MKKICDIDFLKISDFDKKYLEDAVVEKITRSKDMTSYVFFVVSKEILPYEILDRLRVNFKENAFKDKKVNVKIKIRYELEEEYKISDIIEYEKETIKQELQGIDKLLFIVFNKAKISIDDENREITFGIINSDVLNQKIAELKEYLSNFFKERYNISINLTIKNDIEREKDFIIRKIEEEKLDERVWQDEKKVNEESELIGFKKGTTAENKYRKNIFYDEDENIFGKVLVSGKKEIKISEIVNEESDVVVVGTVFDIEVNRTAKSNYLKCLISLTDEKDSIFCIIFVKPDSADEAEKIIKKRIKKGVKLAIRAEIKHDSYYKELMIEHIKSIKIVGATDYVEIKGRTDDDNYILFVTNREDTSVEKRIEFHAHTKYSEMDGVGAVEDYIEAAIKFGMKALAITDHGCIHGLPGAYKYIKSKKKNLKLIIGVEGYLVNDEVYSFLDKNLKRANEKIDINEATVLIDINTTGYNFKRDKLLQIRAVKMIKKDVVAEFNKIINPKKPIDFVIKKKYGISDYDLKNADTEDVVIRELWEFLKDTKCIITFQSSFIYKFLQERFREYNIEFDKNVFDISNLLRLTDIVKTTNLKSVSKFLKLNVTEFDILQNRVDITYEMYKYLLGNTLEQINDFCEVNTLFSPQKESIRKQKANHIILLAKNDVGRVNLYKLISDSYVDYFYRKPKMTKSNIMKYRDGLILGSACVKGELMEAIKDGRNDGELLEMAKFYDYLEIQPLGNNSFLLAEDNNINTIEDLQDLNKKVIELGEKLDKPVIATCDSHYVDKEDKIYRTMLRYGIEHQKKNIDKEGRVIRTEETMEEIVGVEDLYFRTTDEMLKEFEYLGNEKAYEVVIKNTNLINDMIEDNVLPIRLDKCPPRIEGSDEELKNRCYDEIKNRYGDNPPKEFIERLEKELSKIIDNGYSVLYITAKRLIDNSMDNGWYVGSRGSVGSSFVANLIGVSEVNPLPAHYLCPNCKKVIYDERTNKYQTETGFDMPDMVCPICGEKMLKDGANIPFDTFLGIDGGKAKEPDIDLNFSARYQSRVHQFTREFFGADHAIKSGTVLTVADKTAFSYVEKFNEENNTNKRRVEYNREKTGLRDVKRTTGTHPGGMVVVPKDEYIYTFTPINHPANKMDDEVSTHFDYHKIDENLLKLDILGHTTLVFLKILQDLTGVNPLTVPFYEKEVIDLFKGLDSLGIKNGDIKGLTLGCLAIPEFGTNFAMNLVKEAKPQNVADIIRISGLAHGTNVWQGNIRELVLNNVAKISECACCRDDIMLYLIEKGMNKQEAFDIMEKVRKGAGLTDKYIDDMKKVSVPDWYIDSCKKIKYLFPKAHAAAYVVTSLRIAYYKVHYPVAFYTAFFSATNNKNSADYSLMCTDLETLRYNMKKIREMAGSVDEYNKEDNDEMSEDKAISLGMLLKVTEEMLVRGIEWKEMDIYKAKAEDYTVVDGKIMAGLTSINGISSVTANTFCEEAKKAPFQSKEDLRKRGKLNTSVIKEMERLGILKSIREKEEKTIMDILNE